ncbi:MAG: glycerate kinase [Oscillospiraceae bacterium]|nr:glycerate kinase [Oscillospiraceae bacterium]
MKKVIVISDSFKGTISSNEICSIAAETIPRYFPGCEVVTIPAADGGEGTVECFVRALDAEPVSIQVSGAYGEKIEAQYARMGDAAIIEMAAAAGLPSVGERKDPSATTTFGVGEIILHAVESGCKRILLGLGGSATNDCGCGCASALGVRFFDSSNISFVPVGRSLKDIAHIDVSAARELLNGVELTLMCDVENPLYGDKGAAYVFAPQKGADKDMVKRLDDGLRHFAEVVRLDLGIDVSELPGGGAAGGMGTGSSALLGGQLQSGIESILNIIDFDVQLQNADLVISGEGRIDSQSLDGKLISGVSRRTKAAGVPLIALVGCIDESAEAAYSKGVTAMFTIGRNSVPEAELAQRSKSDYRATLEDILRLIKCFESKTAK